MLVLLLILFAGCASIKSETYSDASPYFDAAYNDHNRAPASMTPPQDAANHEKRLDAPNQRALADYHFSVGEAYSFDGKHSQAIESFKTVLIYDPSSIQVKLRLAAEYVKMGSSSEALRLALEASKENPKLIEPHLLLGGLYTSLKNFDDAIKEYETALRLDKKNTDAMMYLGAVYSEKKEYDKAAGYFEALAKTETYMTPQAAYYYIGRIREDQGTPAAQKAAESAYKKALSLKPEYTEASMALAGYYLKQKKNNLAIEQLKNFQRNYGPNLRVAEVLSSLYLQDEKYDLALEQFEIMESDPDETLNVKVKTALIYIDQKQYPKAAEKLQSVLKVAPDSDKIRFYLAAVYEEMGEKAKAIDQFAQVPSISQFYQDSVIHAAYLLKEDKNISEAKKLVEKALTDRKDIPQFYALYASLSDNLESVEKAIATLKAGEEKFPEYVQIQFFLGTLWDRKGDKEQSLRHMKKVIDLDPNHVQGLNYLAFTLAEMGKDLDQAEKMVKRALEIEPKDGFVLDTYGWILFKRGQGHDAVRILEQAHRIQPQESIIAEHLGDAYYKIQLLEKAKKMYEKAASATDDTMKIQQLQTKVTSIEKQELVGFQGRAPASIDQQSNQRKTSGK